MPLGLGTYFGSTGSSGGALDTDARTYCDNALIFGQTPIAYDNAAVFDGTAKFFTSSAASLTVASQSFAVALWVNPSSSSAQYGNILSQGSNPAGANGGWLLQQATTGNQFSFYLRNDNTSSLIGNGFTLTQNAWNFVVVGFDSSTSRSFVSVNGGAFSYSTAYAGWTFPNTTNIFRIGRGIDTINFTGSVSNVGLWKRLLTSDEISRLYNGGLGLPYASFDSALTTNLVSYWRLNDTSDSTASANTLTNNGSTTFTRIGPVATAYDNARSLINSFVLGIKGLNLWANMVCWPLRASQNTSSALTANSLGGLTSAQATLANLGPANTAWGSQGIVGISTSSRLTTAYTLPSTSASILAAWQNLTSSQFNPLAATTVSTNRFVLRSSNPTTSALDAYNGTTNDQFGSVTVPASINFSAASFNSSTSALVFQANALTPTTGTNTGSLAMGNLTMGSYASGGNQGYGLYCFAAALNIPLTAAQITLFRQLWGSTIGQGLGITS